MKRLALALTVVTLAACASEPETVATAPQPTPAPSAAPAPPTTLAPAPEAPQTAAAPAAATAPSPAPATDPVPAPEPAKAKPQHDARTLVYLASYKTDASAKAGFRTLAKVSPILAKQQPITQAVDLGKKGKWIRLYGLAASEGERTAICKQVGKRVDECGARNRE